MREAVEDLGKAFLEIRREGCIQFNDLLVDLHCAPVSDTAVEVNLASIGEQMYGIQTEGKTAADHCRDIVACLNQFIIEWRDNMNSKRW